MKKINKLFAILFAVLGVQSLAAQTDVTSTYLTNADFAGTYSRFLDINTDRGVEKPLGWSVEWYQDNSDQNGMTYVAETMVQDGATWTGKSGNSYFARMRWGNATLYLRQTLQNLRPGNYTLSFSVAGHTTNSENSVIVSVADQTKSITLSSNVNGDWSDYSIDFSITETTPYATVEFKAVREGDLLKIGVDEFKLMYDGSSYYETIIEKAKTLYENNKDWAENGLLDFETAISANEEKTSIADINEAIVALETAMTTFRELNSVDVTTKINNPNFDSNIDGWTTTGGDGNAFQRQTSTQPNFTGGFLEKWRNAWSGGYNQKNFDVSQEIINLPNGEYTVKAYIQAQMQGSKETMSQSYTNKKHGGPYYISNDKGVWMYAVSGDNSSNVWANSHNPTFGETGGGVLRTATVNVTNGQLTIGFKGIGSPNGGSELGTYANWIACDTWTLSYFGFDPSTLLEQITTLKNKAEALLKTEDYNTITGAERTELQNAINMTPEETKTALEEAVANLESSITNFTSATSDYTALATEKIIAAGLDMSDEAIASATANTKTGLAALQDLKVAEYNHIQTTYTESATLGSWTEDFASDLNGEGYKADGPTYMDEWNGSSVTRTAKQTITLPAGDYALSVIARGQAGASGKLYYTIGETTTTVDLIMKGNRGRGVDVNGMANFSETGTYNCNNEGYGWEYRFITFSLTEETAVEIGASVTIAGQWASIYAPVLLTTANSIKSLRLTEIASLLSDVPEGQMNATVQSTLDTKKTAAKAASLENEIDELTTIVTELNSAITDAEASIADYEKIAAYIAKAKVFDADLVTEYETKYDNGKYTADDVETVFQELEVATYQYVTENFKYDVELAADGWVSEGPVGSMSSQHYDGTSTSSYLEQSTSAWNASSWEISYKYEKTLPAGKYIFKVAGRHETEVTMTMSVNNIDDSVVLGSVNDFPEGDSGLGINKNGVTSFNANDEAGFANDNAGCGWQWRYVQFELDAETTVQIAVNAVATTYHQWMSFCDATLKMNESTYLAANIGALDEPMAAAKALVNSTPMGTEEKTALQTAIDLSVNTGAELLAKIDALNTAVATANAWVATYNTEKANLVAALERFEADYNDAENGALAHMNTSRWTTVIEKAGAAAVAKDNQTDYTVLTAATTDLVAALDAADVSIAEYAALKTAIDNANDLVENGINWGDGVFQRPESAKASLSTTDAQAVYDAQTADGEEVTNAAATLAEDNITLNAPETDEVFYWTIATEGHEQSGKAVVASSGDTGDSNPTGYKFNTTSEVSSYSQRVFRFEQAEDSTNLYYIKALVNDETVYVTLGLQNGSIAGHNNWQVQGNTSKEKAVKFKIEASPAVEGAFRIVNPNTETYVDCQSGGSIYTDDGIEYHDFALAKTNDTEVSVAVTISAKNMWSTCILPFATELPEGLRAFKSKSLTDTGLLLTEVTGSLEAYTPYILYAENEFNGTLTGTVDLTNYEACPYDNIALHGAIEKQTITGGYVLQNQGNGVKFHKISDNKEVTIPVGKCWLVVPQTSSASLQQSVPLRFEGGTTGIKGVELDTEVMFNAADGIYTLDGKRVEEMENGNIYIVGGKKILYMENK